MLSKKVSVTKAIYIFLIESSQFLGPIRNVIRLRVFTTCRPAARLLEGIYTHSDTVCSCLSLFSETNVLSCAIAPCGCQWEKWYVCIWTNLDHWTSMNTQGSVSVGIPKGPVGDTCSAYKSILLQHTYLPKKWGVGMWNSGVKAFVVQWEIGTPWCPWLWSQFLLVRG